MHLHSILQYIQNDKSNIILSDSKKSVYPFKIGLIRIEPRWDTITHYHSFNGVRQLHPRDTLNNTTSASNSLNNLIIFNTVPVRASPILCIPN